MTPVLLYHLNSYSKKPVAIAGWRTFSNMSFKASSPSEALLMHTHMHMHDNAFSMSYRRDLERASMATSKTLVCTSATTPRGLERPWRAARPTATRCCERASCDRGSEARAILMRLVGSALYASHATQNRHQHQMVDGGATRLSPHGRVLCQAPKKALATTVSEKLTKA